MLNSFVSSPPTFTKAKILDIPLNVGWLDNGLVENCFSYVQSWKIKGQKELIMRI